MGNALDRCCPFFGHSLMRYNIFPRSGTYDQNSEQIESPWQAAQTSDDELLPLLEGDEPHDTCLLHHSHLKNDAPVPESLDDSLESVNLLDYFPPESTSHYLGNRLDISESQSFDTFYTAETECSSTSSYSPSLFETSLGSFLDSCNSLNSTPVTCTKGIQSAEATQDPCLTHENQFTHLVINPMGQHDSTTYYQSMSANNSLDYSVLNLESPQTASLEWEREPEMVHFSRSKDTLDCTVSMTTNTLDEPSSARGPGPSHLRSSCSTPNSLEWDFKESTMSLQLADGEEILDSEEVWASTETEELILEIEQLAAEALKDSPEEAENFEQIEVDDDLSIIEHISR